LIHSGYSTVKGVCKYYIGPIGQILHRPFDGLPLMTAAVTVRRRLRVHGGG